MPFRTESGTHFHMSYGCSGATIACGAWETVPDTKKRTKTLQPCGTCCMVSGGDGTSPSVSAAVPSVRPTDEEFQKVADKRGKDIDEIKAEYDRGMGIASPDGEGNGQGQGDASYNGSLTRDEVAGLLEKLQEDGSLARHDMPDDAEVADYLQGLSPEQLRTELETCLRVMDMEQPSPVAEFDEMPYLVSQIKWEARSKAAKAPVSKDAKPLPDEPMDRTGLGEATEAQFDKNRETVIERGQPTDMESLQESINGITLPGVALFQEFEKAIRASRNVCLEHIIEENPQFRGLLTPAMQDMVDKLVAGTKVQTGLVSETMMSACVASSMGMTEYWTRYANGPDLPADVAAQLDAETLANAKFIYWDEGHNNVFVQRGDPGEIDILLVSNGKKIRGEIKQDVARFGEADLDVTPGGKVRGFRSTKKQGIEPGTLNQILGSNGVTSLRQQKENVPIKPEESRALALSYFDTHGIDMIFTYNRRGQVICLTRDDIESLPDDLAERVFAGSEIRALGHNLHALPDEERKSLRKSMAGRIRGGTMTLHKDELTRNSKDSSRIRFEDSEGNRDYVIESKNVVDNGDGTVSFPVDAVKASAPSVSAHLNVSDMSPSWREELKDSA